MARVKNTARHGCERCKKGIANDLSQCSICHKFWHIRCGDPTLRALGICEPCELPQEGNTNNSTEEGTSSNPTTGEDISSNQICEGMASDQISQDDISSLDSSESSEQPALTIDEQHNRVEDQPDEPCFIVQKILNHRLRANSREFLIEWEGGDRTWEEESRLDGCVATLKEYIAEFNRTHIRQISETQLTPLPDDRVGSSGINVDAKINWITLDKIIECIMIYRQKDYWKYLNSDLPVVRLPDLDEKSDAIVLITESYHCYVALCYNTGIAYLADGNDQFINDIENRDKVRSMLPNHLILPMATNFTAKQDRCGAAAVIIALELGRFYAGKSMKIIDPNSNMKSRIMNQLHKSSSKNCTEKKVASLRNVIICDICQKRFRNGKASILNMHKLRMHSSKSE